MHGMQARRAAGLFILCVLVFTLSSGCALLAPQAARVRVAPPPGLPLSAQIPDVPYFPQTEHHCGPAALAMALNSAGAKLTPERLIDQVYLPGRKGSLQIEMLAAARRNGMVAYVLEPKLGDLLLEIDAGTPVITLENYGVAYYPIWHYAVAIGFDLHSSEIVRHSGALRAKPTPLAVFDHFWSKEGRWAMVAVPPDRVPVSATEARYAQAVIALEKTGRLREASTAYDAMLKRWPASLTAMMGRGNTAHARGELAQAEAAFRHAAAAHPESVAALNNLAQTLLDRGKLEEAAATARRAVQLGGAFRERAQATLEAVEKKRAAPASLQR